MAKTYQFKIVVDRTDTHYPKYRVENGSGKIVLGPLTAPILSLEQAGTTVFARVYTENTSNGNPIDYGYLLDDDDL